MLLLVEHVEYKSSGTLSSQVRESWIVLVIIRISNFSKLFCVVGEERKLFFLSSCLWMIMLCTLKAVHSVVALATPGCATIMVSEQWTRWPIEEFQYGSGKKQGLEIDEWTPASYSIDWKSLSLCGEVMSPRLNMKMQVHKFRQ